MQELSVLVLILRPHEWAYITKIVETDKCYDMCIETEQNCNLKPPVLRIIQLDNNRKTIQNRKSHTF